MKTNKVMIRRMGQFEVLQRTKDGMFNATELLKQWNKYSDQRKEIKGFTRTENTKEFIKALEERIIEKGEGMPAFIQGRGRGNKTWMHPYLFVKFSMWLNPKFEVQVIEFIYDQLIEYRHQAGDLYRILGRAVARFKDTNYAQMAKGLNYIVFGVHDSELRQQATPEQLRELTDLQKKLAFAVDMGYIRNYDALISEMRRMYSVKWQHSLTA
jgi:hypothetical protein